MDNGQWRKRHKGKDYYVGPWADPDAALREWKRIEASLTLGIEPADPDALTIEDLCDLLTESKQKKLKIGKLSHHTLSDWKSVLGHFLRNVDGNRAADSFRPIDFDDYMSSFPDAWGTASQAKHVALVRSLFNWGVKYQHLQAVPQFGELFVLPEKAERKKEKRDKSKKEFTGAEVYRLLHEADPQIYAMSLLGLNAGFGNTDCSVLRSSDIDGEWLSTFRTKTGTNRKAWLWPETRKALRDVERRKSINDAQ